MPHLLFNQPVFKSNLTELSERMQLMTLVFRAYLLSAWASFLELNIAWVIFRWHSGLFEEAVPSLDISVLLDDSPSIRTWLLKD